MSALTLQNRITVKALSFGRTGSDYQPKPAAAVPLYSAKWALTFYGSVFICAASFRVTL